MSIPNYDCTFAATENRELTRRELGSRELAEPAERAPARLAPSSLRVAIVFDDRARPETTGVYCRRALASLAEVAFFHPHDLANVPRTRFDLFVAIDDGFDYPWPGDLHPCAYWAIDTHMDFERCLRRAAQVDFVFAAQKDGAERLRELSGGGRRGVSGGGLRGSGIEAAQWLPLACDPEVHGKQDVPTRYDVCFVGNLFPGPRTDLVRLLRQYFPNMFVGNAYFEEMARVYSASKIVFNRSLRNDLNMRVFEALASGSLVVTNDLSDGGLGGNNLRGNGQDELFRDGVHLVTYLDSDDLLDKMRYYLRHEDARNRIAAAGRAEVLAKHTYAHRMAELLAGVTRAIAKCKLQNENCGLEEEEVSAERGARSAEQADNEQAATAHGAEERQLAISTVARRASEAGPQSGRRDVTTRSVGTSNVVVEEASEERAEVTGDRFQGTVAHGAILTVARCESEAGPQSGRRDVRGTRAVGRRRGGTSKHDHDPDYFDFDRPEVLALVPTTARTVLEIGCGHGRLGAALKARQECEVVGIELDEQAARVARSQLDRVFDGDMETMENDGWRGQFDVVIAADVLEHLADPCKQLGKIRDWLKPDGILIASIPNVRHASVVKSLLEGNWTYESAGILDTTHLHFFTRRDIQKLFEEAGYCVTSWAHVPGPGYEEWVRQGRPINLDLGRIQLTGMPEEEAEEFFVYQWLVVGKKDESRKLKVESTPSGVNAASAELGTRNAEQEAAQPANEKSKMEEQASVANDASTNAQPPDARTLASLATPNRQSLPPRTLASPATFPSSPQSEIRNPKSLPPCLLLMITYNRLDYTRLSVESVLALDYPNLQIVVWDNASTDGTVEFLQKRLAGVSRARLVTSPVNRGVVYPMNAVWCCDEASEGRSFAERKATLGDEERSFAERKATVGVEERSFAERTGTLGGEGRPFAERKATLGGEGGSFAERKATLGGAELLAKVDNDTWVPPDLLLRLAECHGRSNRFGVLSGFHFRADGESLVDDSRVSELDGVRLLSQPYVGGCAVMVRREVLDRLGPIPFRSDGQQAQFMDPGWTLYQRKMNDEGLVNGYPWPPIHVDHMEDVRSPRCIRTAEHQEYKQALRGMSLEQFTEQLCVWKPIWGDEDVVESGKSKVESQGRAERGALPALGSGIRENSDVDRPEGRGDVVQGRGLSAERGAASAGDQNPSANHQGQPAGILTNPATPLTDAQRPKPNAQSLVFTQDFAKDFDQFNFQGPPFAFVRFADGERAICTGRPIQGADGWNYAGDSSPLRDAMLAALRYSDPDYYIGISDGCCDPDANAWYLREITAPLSHVTFSNIFVNGNYQRFRQLDLSDAATVACEGGDFWVPEHLVNTNFNIDELVERLLQVDRTILVSAGPAACVIIHRYWLRASVPRRQVIVDVGSAIDEWTKGRKTRQYQMPGTRNAALGCTW